MKPTGAGLQIWLRVERGTVACVELSRRLAVA